MPRKGMFQREKYQPIQYMEVFSIVEVLHLTMIVAGAH